MTLVVRAHGGASSVGRNPMDLPRVIGGASSIGLNSMNLVDVISRRPRGGASCKGVIPRRPRGDASLLGHNFIVSWWCLILCIRIVKSWGLK
ncbi:hypothetical protein DEO72_LG1g1732 [Vigna unguiculata]|uniref:Uncharacterized protein n=1 Tax=Vigna unguiculata TaxID=3917 RepID=A0A4D6KNL8_VIGUN|nr:hypothetical protein DEO72_LG1g1732 [Vigna unguiculata]